MGLISFEPKIKDLLWLTTKYESVQRTVAIATPFIELNPIGRGGVLLTRLGMWSWTVLTKKDWTGPAKYCVVVAVVVSSCAFGILFPYASVVLPVGMKTYGHTKELAQHIGRGEWKNSGKDALKLTVDTVRIISIVVASTEWIALSLVLWSLSELSRAYSEYHKGRLPETIAYLILSAIRFNKAAPHLQTLHRNYYGTRLTQDLWESLYSKHLDFPQKPVDVETLFIEKGISSHVKNVRFSSRPLYNLVFRNMWFKECSFARIFNTRFEKIVAEGCSYREALMVDSVVQNSTFRNCDFAQASMAHSLIDRVRFAHSNLEEAALCNAQISNTLIDQCQVRETNFLGANVRRSVIARSDLTDTLLLDAKKSFWLVKCTPNRITKPLVGIIWNYREPGNFTPLIDEVLRKHGVITVRIESQPSDIDTELLGREVRNTLTAIQNEKPAGMLSIVDELLKRVKPGSEMSKITTRAALCYPYLNGLALPGGNDDIPPEYYGAARDPMTHADPDYRRSLTEFELLFHALAHKIPTMGTCRGSQLINIILKGTLKQHVEDQMGEFQHPRFNDSSRKEWAQEFFGEAFVGLSMHHQASDKIGKGLEVILNVDGIPKFMMSSDEKIIASQIHPEIYHPLQTHVASKPNHVLVRELVVPANRKIYELFVEKISAHWIKSLY